MNLKRYPVNLVCYGWLIDSLMNYPPVLQVCCDVSNDQITYKFSVIRNNIQRGMLFVVFNMEC